jgi:ABC-2 type transport system ATP-binding protein
MCDEIALINKSNKILDGKLSDIKKQFKTNTFQIGLQTDSPKEVEQLLKKEFEILPANFKLIDDSLSLNIRLTNNQSANDLLHYLTSKGEVKHFVELVPSANEIFIKAVNNN